MARPMIVDCDNPLILVEEGAGGWRDHLALESARYHTASRLEQEKRLMARSWIVAGCIQDAPNDGDFFTVDLFGNKLLVVNRESGYQAFFNVCTHRCRQLVEARSGNGASFRCAYHAWTFGNDGRLRGMPSPEHFPGLDTSKKGLTPVATDVWNGLVFVNLDGNAGGLREYLGPIDAALQGWHRPANVRTNEHVELGCNWKVVIDNFIEFYHLHYLHGQRKGTSFPEKSGFVLLDRHSLQVIAMRSRKDWIETRSVDWNAWLDVPRSRDIGLAIHLNVFPNLTIHVVPHYGVVTYFEAVPHATDPARCDFYIRRFGVDDGPIEMQRMMQQVTQDIGNMTPAHAGLGARGGEQQSLSLLECRVAHLHKMLDREIETA